MIVTDNFVFLHMHKSGGTFVLSFLQEFEPQAHMVGYHLPYPELPQEYRQLPVLGTVRNPWSYYVSWYTFQAAMANPNPLFLLVSNNGQLGFSATTRNLVTLSESPQRLELLEHTLPESFRPRGLNLTRHCIGPLHDNDVGFYTFLFERMYSGCDNPRIMQMENLREDLLDALPGLGRQLSQEEVDYINATPPTNTTAHGHYAEYYNEELRDLVAQKDSAVIRRFGYSFD